MPLSHTLSPSLTLSHTLARSLSLCLSLSLAPEGRITGRAITREPEEGPAI